MLTFYSSNAVLAKARTMFGKRLNSNDYNNLIESKSVTDIAMYLKNNTVYGKYMGNLNDGEIHRGRLEAMLKAQYYNACSTLCRYEITVGDYFYKYIIDKAEISIIMHFLVLLACGKTDEYIYSMPIYMDKHSIMDNKALASIKTYDEFLEASKKTAYYNIFKSNKPKNGVYDFARIENMLYNELYKNMFEIIKSHTRKKEKKELYDVFTSYLDALNFDRIMRLKKYFGLQGQQLLENLLSFGNLTPASLEKMSNASNEEELFSALTSCPAGRKLNKYFSLSSREIATSILVEKCRHNIRYSLYPSVVMLSYLFLSENEIKNICTIIEGVRYNVSSDTIRNLLIL